MNANKLLSLSIRLTFLAITFFHVPRFFAQSIGEQPLNETGSVQLVLNAGQTNEARLPSQNGFFPPVSLHPGQSLSFSLQFSGNRAGSPMMIGCMDGGQMISVVGQSETLLSKMAGQQQNLTISGNATRDFRFEPGQTTGAYRVLVQLPDEQYYIRVFVVDPNAPHIGGPQSIQP